MINSNIIRYNSQIKEIYGELPELESNVSTDSRSLRGAEIFIGLKGPNFNGANYCKDVLDQGVKIFIYEAGPEIDNRILTLHEKYLDRCIISTKNVLEFIQTLAATHVKKWKDETSGKVICITGSNGKTTNKEMLANFLEVVFPRAINYTKGNLNNQIGVPLTLLELTDSDKISIVEIGTNSPGEIKELCRIADPDFGLITNIGKAHLEFFIDEEGVFKEKSELYNYIRDHNDLFKFIIDGEDQQLRKLSNEKNVISFGENTENYRVKYDNEFVTIDLDGEQIKLENKFILGKHNFKNLIATFLLAYSLWPEKKDDLIKRAGNFKPKGNRSTWINKKNYRIFLDAYNANPSSMEASLLAFIEFTEQQNAFPEKCSFVIGDMNELGENSLEFHKEIGKLLKNRGAVNVNFVGKFTAAYTAGYGADCMVYFKSSEIENLFSKDKNIEYFFIKGSRSLQLESILDIS